MLLVVDVGNTQTHLGVYDGTELVHDWRFATVRESTADELGAALTALLALRGFGFADIDASIVSRHRPLAAPAVDGDGPALPRPRDAAGRPGAADRDADPLRQPARDRPGPARQRRRRLRARRRGVRDRGLRHGGHARRRERGRGVPRRRDLPGPGDLDGGAVRARGRAAGDRPHAAARADRQVDGRRDPRRRALRLRGHVRRDHRPPARRARRLQDAGHRRPGRARSSRTAGRSTSPTTCSRSRACASSGSATRLPS